MLCALFPATGFATASDSWWAGQTPAEDTVSSTSAAAADWDISKSKTATNLDENFQSQITLSLPSAEEPLATDVVFVMDKSTSNATEEEIISMLGQLKEQVQATNAQVKVGVVIFNKQANITCELTDLATGYDAITAAVKAEYKSGTNLHAGLLAGKEMLDKDTSVDAGRKYLILISDGITYMYDADAKVTSYYWMSDGSPYYSVDPYAWQFHYGDNNPPESWSAWMEEVGATLPTETVSEILYDNKGSLSTDNAVNTEDLNAYTTNVDRALYKSYQVYQSAQQSGYHCYAVMKETSTEYQWGPSFINFLANGQTVSFSQIQNDIVYLLDAGSTVVDVMGETEEYDFDFVNDPSKLSLTVGGTALPVEKIKENLYGFGSLGEGEYRFTLEYIPETEQAGDSFVWYINEAVTITQPVQLVYSVVLTNPQTAPGTYGQYDRDGSKGYDSLYTNNSAVLTPVDSNGQEGMPEAFAKPTVSYNIEENKRPTIPTKPDSQTKPDSKPEDSNPNTGAGSFDGVLVSLVIAGVSGALLALKRRTQK